MTEIRDMEQTFPYFLMNRRAPRARPSSALDYMPLSLTWQGILPPGGIRAQSPGKEAATGTPVERSIFRITRSASAPDRNMGE